MRDFESFIEDGTVRRVTPDLNRASFLRKEAEKRMVFLRKIQQKVGVSDDDANYVVENCYNVLSESLRSRMLESGYSASGLGAHEAEVAFMKNLLFSDADIIFMDNLRYFRNGILYYGKILDKEYADKVLDFVNRIYKKLNC